MGDVDMNQIMKSAQSILLETTDVDAIKLESIVAKAASSGCDFADVYLQDCMQEAWFLEDGLVKETEYSVDRGFGLRAVRGEAIGFAHSDHLSLLSLENAVSVVNSIARSGSDHVLALPDSGTCKRSNLYQSHSPFESMTDIEKVDLLHKVDRYARSKDPRVKKVFVRLESSFDTVIILDSDGRLSADIRPLVHMSVRVLVEEKGRTEQGRAGGGARSDLLFYLGESRALRYADEAVRQALVNLEAQPVPAGDMTVVLGGGWPAVLLHEAVGHGLEADFNRKGSSVFSDKMGAAVASSLCTIIDDATLPNARGSLSIDDEGTSGQSTVLIEKGVLKGYMTDKHNALLMGLPLTGNGRRESYASPPLPRMSSTYMQNGDSDPEEIISSVVKGIYAVDFAGGQVDITSGKFVFTMSEAYLIENGKLTQPVKGATLIGNGVEVLQNVSMVGNDLSFDPGIGHCGKDGQSVPVGVGQPTLKLNRITVGGTQT